MASALVKTRWPVSGDFPDFFEFEKTLQSHYGGGLSEFHFEKYKNPVGIEVEVEGWMSHKPSLLCWEAREDGSLKDHGMEFVSKILSGPIIDWALIELQRVFVMQTTKLKWSHRTSIHVHVNLKSLPAVKLKWLVAYYALMEPIWYSFCDEKRKGNSFCFPITTCNPRDVQVGQKWPKYCGMNLGTSLTQFNTVEFRQMHGHENIKLLINWIRMISNFIDWIYATPSLEMKKLLHEYLLTGKPKLPLKTIFGKDLPSNYATLIYDNAKWVADYIA